MKKKSLLIFLSIFYILSMFLGSIPVKASGTDGLKSISDESGPNIVDTISVERKNIVVPNLQMVTVNIKNNTGLGYIDGSYTGIKDMYVSYKVPSGTYSQVHLSRNQLTETSFKGYMHTFYSEVGNWVVASITVTYFNGSFRTYFDIDEGGIYELNDGNYTVYSSDTTGPVLDNLSVNPSSVLSGGSVTVTVDAHDELSDIQSVQLSYKAQNGGYYQLTALNVGNNQFQLEIPSFMTSGNTYIGKFECAEITLVDSYNNSTSYYDYSYYSTRDLSSGDFIVKPEFEGPVLKNISVDKKEITSGDSVKIFAEVEDASGTKEVKVTFRKPDGSTYTAILNHSNGNMYEGEIPGSITSTAIGNWDVHFVWVNDIYDNSLYIWSNSVYWWGEDLSNGNFQIKERDVTPPAKPVVNDVTDKDTSVTGQAEAGSSITVKAGTTVVGTEVAKDDGTFSVPIMLQKAGTKLMVTASDLAGNVSEVNEIVVKDVTAPDVPKVYTVSNKSTSVNGKTEKYAMVTVKIGTKAYTAKADVYGNYKVAIPVQNAGTNILITATDSMGNISSPRTTTVVRVAPNRPTVNTVNNKSTSVTGKTGTYATVTVKIGTKSYTAKADVYGNYKVIIPVQNSGTSISITAADSKGNVSAAQTTTVLRVAPNRPTVYTVTNKSTSVAGKTEKYAEVTVKIGTTTYTAKANVYGNYKVTIPVQNTGTKIYVNAKDSMGMISATKTVIVSS